MTVLQQERYNMHRAIATKKSEIARICERFRVRRLALFGSAARAADFDPAQSDADFLVEYQPGTPRGLGSYFGPKAALEAVLSRPVDLVETKRLSHPYLLADINRHRELLYGA